VNLIDAAHKTVHDYPGGSQSLGPRIDMSPAILRNKVNPNNETHHLTLAEADEIMSVTGDHRILHALAAQHGYVLQKADEVTAGASLLQVLLSANAAEGNFDSVLQEALADGKITPNEMKAITEAGMRQTSTHMALLRLCQTISQQAIGGEG
jgi:hypothetical protein